MGPRLSRSDLGAYVSATPDLIQLINPTNLVQSIQIGCADQESGTSLATQLGCFNLTLADGS